VLVTQLNRFSRKLVVEARKRFHTISKARLQMVTFLIQPSNVLPNTNRNRFVK